MSGYYQQTLYKVLSDPNFEPPEELLGLNLKGNFRDLLKSCRKKAYVKFAIGEAELVLPIFEAKHPYDFRPRKAVEITKKWLKEDPTFNLTDAYHAAENADDADIRASDVAASHAAATAAKTARVVINKNHTYYVTFWARRADPSITLEGQLRRLFKVMREA